MDRFTTYTEQQQFEVERLIDDFGTERKVVLLGDFNAGPDGPDAVAEGAYCASHVLVQPNFRRYYFYFLPDQAQTHLDHFNVLDELWC